MKIEKYHFVKGEALAVNGNIHFDYNFAFCGRPYVRLITTKNAYCGWKDYQIGVAIHKNGDFDIGYVYTTENEVQFFDVLHELINWMNDLEHGVCFWEEFIDDINGFFPECGCKKEKW